MSGSRPRTTRLRTRSSMDDNQAGTHRRWQCRECKLVSRATGPCVRHCKEKRHVPDARLVCGDAYYPAIGLLCVPSTTPSYELHYRQSRANCRYRCSHGETQRRASRKGCLVWLVVEWRSSEGGEGERGARRDTQGCVSRK